MFSFLIFTGELQYLNGKCFNSEFVIIWKIALSYLSMPSLCAIFLKGLVMCMKQEMFGFSPLSF